MLLVIRHGQTLWNVSPKRCQGHLDVGLSEDGREAARAFAPTLPRLDAVWSSPLLRARQTAEILLAGTDLLGRLRLDARLAEAACGAWEGMLFREIARRWPDAWAAVKDDDLAFAFPGGDALEAVRARFAEVVAELDERHEGQTALVVTHGGPMRLFLRERGLLRTRGPGSPPRNLDGFRLASGRVELLRTEST